MTVAVLYADALGPYPALARGEYPDVWPKAGPIGPARDLDVWDITRDARKYEGPHPVVAHPPCKLWGRLRHLAHVECPDPDCGWHGPESEAGGCIRVCPECGHGCWSDADCAPRAVEQVRRWGGVLEHPAGSKLWEHCGLPAAVVNAHCPFVPDHIDTEDEPFPVDAHGGYTIEVDQVEWGHVARKRTWLYLVGVPRSALEAPPFPGREPTHSVAWRSKAARAAGRRECSAEKRRRTPPLFAEYLIRLARQAVRP